MRQAISPRLAMRTEPNMGPSVTGGQNGATGDERGPHYRVWAGAGVQTGSALLPCSGPAAPGWRASWPTGFSARLRGSALPAPPRGSAGPFGSGFMMLIGGIEAAFGKSMLTITLRLPAAFGATAPVSSAPPASSASGSSDDLAHASRN